MHNIVNADSYTPTGSGHEFSAYRHHIAHLGLPPDQEAELLKTVWHIMESFVDRAFGDDPVQHVHEMRVMDDERPAVMVGSGNTKSQNQDDRLSSAFASPAAGLRRKERP